MDSKTAACSKCGLCVLTKLRRAELRHDVRAPRREPKQLKRPLYINHNQ